MTDFLTALAALAQSPLVIYLAGIGVLVAIGVAYAFRCDRRYHETHFPTDQFIVPVLHLDGPPDQS